MRPINMLPSSIESEIFMVGDNGFEPLTPCV
jgi:hypothetical protein